MTLIHVTLCAVLAIATEGILLETIGGRHITQILTVGNGQQWGKFVQPEMCFNGTYATGYYLKLQEPKTNSDETGINGIALSCTTSDQNERFVNVTSDVSPWGVWEPLTNCPMGQALVRFELKVQESQLTQDDTAVDGVRFRCRDINGTKVTDVDSGKEAPFGSWGQPSTSCPQGSAICGLMTKVEPKQDIGSVINFDDTALNDAMFYCCDK